LIKQSQSLSVNYKFRCACLVRALTVQYSLFPLNCFLKSTEADLGILIIKPMRCTNISNLFWNRTLHVSDNISVHRQESSTVHTAIGIGHTCYADCLLASSQHNMYVLLCVTIDRDTVRNM